MRGVKDPLDRIREFEDHCEALENAPLIYELDLVRPDRTTSQRLREKIEREGIAIYPDGNDAAPSDL